MTYKEEPGREPQMTEGCEIHLPVAADPAKSEAECATSETYRWGALDAP